MFADWEEIPADDYEALNAWYVAVWDALNPTDKCASWHSKMYIDSETGISPDCLVQRVSFWKSEWVRVSEIRLGDYIRVGTEETRVVGIVEIDPYEITKVVELPSECGPQTVSCSVWMRQYGRWQNPNGFKLMSTHHGMPPFRQLYTQNGKIELCGGWQLRDASDVGLTELRPLVESIVLKSG